MDINAALEEREGLSFTLTLVVIGVILLMTALTVIVLGQTGITETIMSVLDWGGASSVEAACDDLAEDINDNYCDLYVNTNATDACTDTNNRHDTTTGHTQTASEYGCSWEGKEELTEGGITSPVLTEDDDGTMRPIVEVDGETYNCIDQGHMSNTQCPA